MDQWIEYGMKQILKMNQSNKAEEYAQLFSLLEHKKYPGFIHENQLKHAMCQMLSNRLSDIKY